MPVSCLPLFIQIVRTEMGLEHRRRVIFTATSRFVKVLKPYLALDIESLHICAHLDRGTVHILISQADRYNSM